MDTNKKTGMEEEIVDDYDVVDTDLDEDEDGYDDYVDDYIQNMELYSLRDIITAANSKVEFGIVPTLWEKLCEADGLCDEPLCIPEDAATSIIELMTYYPDEELVKNFLLTRICFDEDVYQYLKTFIAYVQSGKI